MTDAADAGARLLADDPHNGLPQSLRQPGQDTSVIVRLRGRQQAITPQAVAPNVSPSGRPHLTCQLGGLVLVLHTAEALTRPVTVADTAHQVAAVLWPQAAQRVHDVGPDDGRDAYAEAWEATHRRQ